MKTALIACQTMQREFQKVLEAGAHAPESILWIKSGLHNVSETLRTTIQDALGQVSDADLVLLGFGACGNALVGIQTGNFVTVLPRVDDCISIMLGAYEVKKEIQTAKGGTYFFTKGWLEGESNIHTEYLFCVDKYGKEMADAVNEEMLGAYKNLGIIDTTAYDYQSLLAETEEIAKDLRLTQLKVQGTLSYIERLLAGDWQEGSFEESSFLVLPPHTVIENEMFAVKRVKRRKRHESTN